MGLQLVFKKSIFVCFVDSHCLQATLSCHLLMRSASALERIEKIRYVQYSRKYRGLVEFYVDLTDVNEWDRIHQVKYIKYSTLSDLNLKLTSIL